MLGMDFLQGKKIMLSKFSTLTILFSVFFFKSRVSLNFVKIFSASIEMCWFLPFINISIYIALLDFYVLKYFWTTHLDMMYKFF